MKGSGKHLKLLTSLIACVALLLPAAADAGTVKGSVTPLESAQEVEVCEVEKLPSELCTVPASDGSYVLENVPLGAVRIEFVPSFRSRLLPQYYDHKSRLSEATLFFLTQSQPTATHIDADLVEGGVIDGTVTATGSGTPLAEVEACAVSTSVPTVKRCAEIDGSGAYELHSLPTGSYRIGFWGRGESAEYQPQYYNREQEPSHSDFVSVNAGGTVPGIDAVLEPGAEIDGTVSDTAGVPLTGIAVCLFDASAAAAERCTYSGEVGSYSFKGLPSGSYQVGFSLEPSEAGLETGVEADGFESQYFDGVATRAGAVTIMALAPALIGAVDAHLAPPAQPTPTPPAPAVTSPIVAAPPVISEPKPPAKRCKKGFRKKKVKGTVRCVRIHKPGHRHRKHKSHRREGKKG